MYKRQQQGIAIVQGVGRIGAIAAAVCMAADRVAEPLASRQPDILFGIRTRMARARLGFDQPSWSLAQADVAIGCLLYTFPNPRDRTRTRMPASALKKKKKNTNEDTQSGKNNNHNETTH